MEITIPDGFKAGDVLTLEVDGKEMEVPRTCN